MRNFCILENNSAIFVGEMNPTKENGTKTWKAKTECTQESIEAVRDLFLHSAEKCGLDCVFKCWEINGKHIKLMLEIVDE